MRTAQIGPDLRLRRGRQARNFTTNAPKTLDPKSSSEQIFSRKLPLGAPDSIIQTGDLPSFLQILQIPMSSLLARKIRVRLLFMYFFYSILNSVLLGGFPLGDRQLYLLHAFTIPYWREESMSNFK